MTTIGRVTAAASLQRTLDEFEARCLSIEVAYRTEVAAAKASRDEALARITLEAFGAPGEVGVLRERHGLDERAPLPEVTTAKPKRVRDPRARAAS